MVARVQAALLLAALGALVAVAVQGSPQGLPRPTPYLGADNDSQAHPSPRRSSDAASTVQVALQNVISASGGANATADASAGHASRRLLQQFQPPSQVCVNLPAPDASGNTQITNEADCPVSSGCVWGPDVGGTSRCRDLFSYCNQWSGGTECAAASAAASHGGCTWASDIYKCQPAAALYAVPLGCGAFNTGGTCPNVCSWGNSDNPSNPICHLSKQTCLSGYFKTQAHCTGMTANLGGTVGCTWNENWGGQCEAFASSGPSDPCSGPAPAPAPAPAPCGSYLFANDCDGPLATGCGW